MLVAALTERDFGRLVGTLAPDVRMRALIPPVPVELSGTAGSPSLKRSPETCAAGSGHGEGNGSSTRLLRGWLARILRRSIAEAGPSDPAPRPLADSFSGAGSPSSACS
jgi:hypothetical protein